jgi:predicted DNA-binding transcriptional regulator AlpA
MPRDTTKQPDKRGHMRRTLAAATDLPPELDRERALDVSQVVALTGHAAITLAQWRAHGKGPAWFRCGRSIRYRLGDVLDWRNARTIGKAQP